MLRARQMTWISQRLALLMDALNLPEDVSCSVDIDPADLS